MVKPGRADVVVVGGGVIGCAVARELAVRGLRVTVVERERPGTGATAAAGGMLSPLAEAGGRGPFLELALAGLRRYAAFAAAVEEATGLEVEYRECGKLLVAVDEDEVRRLAARYAWQRDAGHRVEWYEGEAVRELQPGIAPEIRAALLVADDFRVDNRRLGHAVWAAAAAAGAGFRLGEAAVRIESAPAPAGARVRGVRLGGGELLEAPRVVLAGGAWSGGIAGLPRPLPVVPERGQIVAVRATPPVTGRVVQRGHCYLIPRGSGRLLIGATAERAGFRAEATAGGVGSLLAAAVSVLPALAEAPILETWAGLRPATPDGYPILGADPDLDGLVYATGHHRNGILLAPVTAEAIADVVTGGTPSVVLDAFGVERFGVEDGER